MTTLNIISVNTTGLNSKEKRDKFYRWIIDTKLDVILIQETHFVEKYALQYECGWNGLSLHCFSDSPFSRGVSILFRKGLDINIISIHKTKEIVLTALLMSMLLIRRGLELNFLKE